MSFRHDMEDFLLYCELTKQYSLNTVRNYRNTLDRFALFLEKQTKVERTNQIDMDIVNKYRQYLNRLDTIRGEKMSLKAQAYQIIVLRSLLKFLSKNGSLVLNPDRLELPKTRMRRIEFLTEPEIKKLIASILNDTTIPDILKKRNQAIITTIFGSGLRLSELLGLRKAEIPEEDETQVMIQGKGGKVRMTFLSPESKEAIKIYLETRGLDENPFLFISHSKNRPKETRKFTSLTPRMVQMMLQSYANRLGIYKHITPHTLRHSFATKILNEGGDLRSVQTLLGHSNLATTQIYTHITDWQIRELHQKVFGGKKKAKPKEEE